MWPMTGSQIMKMCLENWPWQCEPEICTLIIREYRVLTLTMWPEICALIIREYRVLTLIMWPEICTLTICEYRVYWPCPRDQRSVPWLYVSTEYWPWPCDQRSVPWLYVSTECWPWPCDHRPVPCLYVTTEYIDLDHVTRGLYLDYMWPQSILTLTMCPEACTLILCDHRVYWPWPCVQRSIPWP